MSSDSDVELVDSFFPNMEGGAAFEDVNVAWNEGKSDLIFSDLGGPYHDEPLANNELLERVYNWEVGEAERRDQELQNHFDIQKEGTQLVL